MIAKFSKTFAQEFFMFCAFSFYVIKSAITRAPYSINPNPSEAQVKRRRNIIVSVLAIDYAMLIAIDPAAPAIHYAAVTASSILLLFVGCYVLMRKELLELQYSVITSE